MLFRSVYSGNDKYGGYNEALDADGYPVNAGVRNPRGLVDLYDSKSKVSRFIGSMDVDYKVHFLPDLKLHATVGADYAKGDGTVYVPAYAAQSYNKDESLGGSDYKYGPQKNENRAQNGDNKPQKNEGKPNNQRRDNRNQGNHPKGDNRQPRNDRRPNKGNKPQNGNKPQGGNKPQNGNNAPQNGNKPQGNNAPQGGNKPQGNNAPQE